MELYYPWISGPLRVTWFFDLSTAEEKQCLNFVLSFFSSLSGVQVLALLELLW